MGGNAYYLPNPSLIFSYVQKFYKFLKEHEEEYCAIHIHEVYLTFLLAPIAYMFGLKVITHSHSTKFSDKLLHAIRNRIACLRINKRADLCLACSIAAGIALYGKNAKFTVINNAIDLGKFAFNLDKRVRLRENLGVNNKLVIGHVGRFNEQKNHKFLIEIFYETQKTLQNAVLILIGEGPLMESVKWQVLSLGLHDKVLFLGRRTDVADLYNAMDIFLLPSLFEGLPVVAVEAQANGLPCILSDTITKEVAIDKAVFVSLHSAPSEWKDKIAQIQPIGHGASDMTKLDSCGFNINIAVQKLTQLYQELA